MPRLASTHLLCAALKRRAPLALSIALITGCGIPKQTHLAAIKNAEDAHIELAKTQSRSILAEKDLKTTQAQLRRAQSDLATLKREKQQQLNSKPNTSDAELIEAAEEIVRAQDELLAALRQHLTTPLQSSAITLQIKGGYITIAVEPSALFDAKDSLTSQGKTLATLIFEGLQAQAARALLVCHPSSDAKDHSATRCDKQLKVLGTFNSALKSKAAALGIMQRLVEATPTQQLEIIILPELEMLGQELEDQPEDDVKGGIIGGVIGDGV